MGIQDSTVPSIAVGTALLAATALPMRAQPPAVSVPVSVTTSRNAFVPGLTAADFRLLEDGVEQRLESAEAGPGPVSVVIVVDTRDSTAGIGQELAQRAIERMVAALNPDDQIAVISTMGKTFVAVPWSSPREFPPIDWSRWRTMPFSELLQGVYQGLGLVNDAQHPRAAVIAITDSEQFGSKHSLRDMLKHRRESEAGIYGLRTADLMDGAADIGGPRPSVNRTTIWDSRGALVSFEDLVRDAGGRIMPARLPTEADKNAAAMIAELRHQYVLTFRPAKPFDGSYRKIKVELRNGSHRVRTRVAYLASVR
jgi:hypothetical protein